MIRPGTVLGNDSPQKLIADLQANTAQELIEILVCLKGASTEVSQLPSCIEAAVLAEEVSDVCQEILRSLRDAAPPMDPGLVDQVLFDEFDTEPERPSP